MNADREQEIRSRVRYTLPRGQGELQTHYAFDVTDLLAALDAERALREQAEQKREKTRENMKVLIADTNKWQNAYDRARDRVAQLEQALTEIADIETREVLAHEIARAALAGDAETKATQ